jgi:pyruvate/2-oxoglutarate dehydrogenase complex dihydrolipoamide dehydrogenase (E3) component
VTERFDVFVIGGGGTGSEVAFRLGRRSGLRVAIAERDKLGGECNHYGCVPTKVMLRSAKIAQLAREAGRFGVRIPSVDVDFRAVRQRARDVIETLSGEGAAPFERIGITVHLQEARLVGERTLELADGTRIEAERVVLATGTEATVPPIPGLADGPYWTNREAIWEPERPPRSLAVIGTGAIGIEFSQIYARFGSRVTAIEVLPQILPSEDEESAAALVQALEAEGIRLLPGSTVERAAHDGAGWRLWLAGGETIEAEEVLVATGRRPVFDGHDLGAAGVEIDDGGRPILSDTLRTTAEGIWAAGDATGDLLFTHVGGYEAALVVDDILGTPRPRDYRVVPRVTFCDPEVASVGLTEREARDAGHVVRTAVARLEDNERAHIEGRTLGVVKLVADAGSGELLGGHVVGEEAGAMIHEVVAAMAGRVPAHVLGDAIHAYPTCSESVKGAFELLASRLGEG